MSAESSRKNQQVQVAEQNRASDRGDKKKAYFAFTEKVQRFQDQYATDGSTAIAKADGICEDAGKVSVEKYKEWERRLEELRAIQTGVFVYGSDNARELAAAVVQQIRAAIKVQPLQPGDPIQLCYSGAGMTQLASTLAKFMELMCRELKASSDECNGIKIGG